LIDEDGENIGVVTPERALIMAEDAGLDLVEISPNANPPVCKIMDYGKFKYESQKKEAEARQEAKDHRDQRGQIQTEHRQTRL
jgi:translation initiation factor IF-3